MHEAKKQGITSAPIFQCHDSMVSPAGTTAVLFGVFKGKCYCSLFCFGRMFLGVVVDGSSSVRLIYGCRKNWRFGGWTHLLRTIQTLCAFILQLNLTNQLHEYLSLGHSPVKHHPKVLFFWGELYVLVIAHLSALSPYELRGAISHSSAANVSWAISLSKLSSHLYFIWWQVLVIQSMNK